MPKKRVFHFLGSGGGGVLSVVANLLKFSKNPSIENHVIYTVNKDIVPLFETWQLEGANSEQIFYYSAKWNFYYTCRQLSKLLPDQYAVIIAHDWLELGMISNLGLQNPVIQVLHGDFEYYYNLSLQHKEGIDAFVGISPTITQKLQKIIPEYTKEICYLNFPVPAVLAKVKENKKLHLIYYVRDLTEDRKQFKMILDIARLLSDNADNYHFTIAGGGITNHEFYALWPVPMMDSVDFIGLKTNEELLAVLEDQDIFLLPSLAEGFPVSLVEAMKAGLVPLVTNWIGATDELLTPGLTGYYFSAGAYLEYVECIKMLQKNRRLLQTISGNAKQRANMLFDPISNTKKIEDLFLAAATKKNRLKKSIRVYGSRLDAVWIPNLITYFARSLSNKIK